MHVMYVYTYLYKFMHKKFFSDTYKSSFVIYYAQIY